MPTRPPQIDDRVPVFAAHSMAEGETKLVKVRPSPSSRYRVAPLFVRSKSGEAVWMPLLEKAFAKYCGSYARLNGGLVHLVLPMLVPHSWPQHLLLEGMPLALLWRLLSEAKDDHALLGAGSPAVPVDPHSGIASGHAYAVLSLHELSSGDRLVKLQ